MFQDRVKHGSASVHTYVKKTSQKKENKEKKEVIVEVDETNIKNTEEKEKRVRRKRLKSIGNKIKFTQNLHNMCRPP